MKYGVPGIFAAIAIVGSAMGIVRSNPSGWLITMTMASYFCLLLVYFGDRLKSFSIRDLAARLHKAEVQAASSKEIAKQTADLALKTMRAARAHEYYGSSSESCDESSSSSWEDIEESADELRRKLNA
jgi:hypothetical protein